MVFLYIKVFHIIFIMAWFAGLFYLPRIFVNLAMIGDEATAERQRLLLMGRKLFRFTTIMAIPAIFFGEILFRVFDVGAGSYWIHVKMIAVILTLCYHASMWYWLRQFELGRKHPSHIWFRWYNEIPLLLLLVAVIMVVVKPF